MDEYSIMRNPWVDDDLDNLYAYILGKFLDPFAAKNTLAGIIRAMEGLRFAPERGALLGVDKNQKQVRSISVKGYAIVFVLDNKNKRVEIIAVVMGRRDISGLLDTLLRR